MVNQEHVKAVVTKSATPNLINRAANFLADQARRNFTEARKIKAARSSAVYVRLTDNAINMSDTANALQQIASNQCPTCEYCGAAVAADRMLCDNCNDQFADVSF